MARLMAALATVATLSLLAAASASATPPQVESVGAIGGKITARWSLPPGVAAVSFDTVLEPAVTRFGYFEQCTSASPSGGCISNRVDFVALQRRQTAFRGTFSPLPGVYYVHVGGSDFSCFACPRVEFSDIWEVEIGPGGAGTGKTLAKGKGPSLFVTRKRRQDIDKLYVSARMDIEGSLSAQGTVRVSGSGSSRTRRFGLVTKQVGPDSTTKLSQQLGKSDKRAVKRALRKGKRVRARITISARDGFGRTTSKRVTVGLKD
jgi:hypothetical protein